MYLPVYVTRVAVLTLLDTVASRTFVSMKCSAMTKLHVDHDVLMVLQLPTGRSETVDCVLHCKLLIDNIIYA